MNRTRRACVVLFVALVLLGASSASAQEELPAPPPTDARPNIVFVLTDDMRAGDLRFMPKTNALVRNQGVSFQNAFVTTPTCCPSRASIFRGQYAHNTGVWSNYPPAGGAQRFEELGRENSTFATWLDSAGYRTGFVGKYLNSYDGGHVPPGWDYWRALEGDFYKDLKLNEDGTTVDYPEGVITDELLGEKAREFLSAGGSEPFFLELSTHSPHRPAEYDTNPYPDTMRSPRSPSYEEEDVSDKPRWIRKARALYDDGGQLAQNWDRIYRGRAASLRVVDDQVASLVEVLRVQGELENTYVFFTSDNGFHFGEHGLWSKGTPYTESLEVPLLARGPGIEPGVTEERIALNTDFAPTFADLAGAGAPSWVDGRSLRPLLKPEPTSWRTRFLYEYRSDPGFYVASYAGVRTAGWSYTQYRTDEQEFYNLNKDPYQLTSRHKKATTAVATAKKHLEALRKCTGDGCRAAEGH